MLLFLAFAAQVVVQEPVGPPAGAAEAPPAEAPPAEATVMLDCLSDGRGRMSDCRIVSENPPGHGFGEAALAGASRARLAPRTSRIRATGRVRFTVRFAAAPNP
jgi:hypothetical protein